MPEIRSMPCVGTAAPSRWGPRAADRRNPPRQRRGSGVCI